MSNKMKTENDNTNRSPIVLFSPEHFYVFNTNALPQLTGYLTVKGYSVMQRVLDNEFYAYVTHPDILASSLRYLKLHRQDLSHQQVDRLKNSFVTARLTEILNIKKEGPQEVLDGILSNGSKVINMLHKAEQLLTNSFLKLSKKRFLLSMARLQCAIDLFTAAYRDSQFCLLSGASFSYGAERTDNVYRAVKDSGNNFLLCYYEKCIIPTIPSVTRIVGISITHDSQIIPAFTLARQVKIHRPEVHITLGGATVGILRETLGNDNALWEFYDSLIVGAGEEPLAKLYDQINSESRNLALVPQLIWKTADSQIKRSLRESTFNMQQVETPIFTDPRPNPIITLTTSAGCDWAKCSYCHFPQLSSSKTTYLMRDIEHVIRDVKSLEETYSPSYFHVCDTNVSVGRIEKLADALIESGQKSCFYSFVRSEKKFADPEFCRKIRKAGFFALHFGLESGSQRVLNYVKKGIHLSTVKKIIRNFFEAGIMVNVFVMVGTPGEQVEDIDKTVAFLREELPLIKGEVAISRYYLEKHSAVYQQPEKFGLTVHEDKEADLNTYVNFGNPNGISPKDSQKLVEHVFQRIGLPVSYGERFFFELLDQMCPDETWQDAVLYAPFIWSKAKRMIKRLVLSV